MPVPTNPATLDEVFQVLADVLAGVPGIQHATADPPSTLSSASLPMAVPFPPGEDGSQRERTAGTVRWLHSCPLIVFICPVKGDYVRELALVRSLIEAVPHRIERARNRDARFGSRVDRIEAVGVGTGIRAFGRDGDGNDALYHAITYPLVIQIRETPGELR